TNMIRDRFNDVFFRVGCARLCDFKLLKLTVYILHDNVVSFDDMFCVFVICRNTENDIVFPVQLLFFFEMENRKGGPSIRGDRHDFFILVENPEFKRHYRHLSVKLASTFATPSGSTKIVPPGIRSKKSDSM